MSDFLKNKRRPGGRKSCYEGDIVKLTATKAQPEKHLNLKKIILKCLSKTVCREFQILFNVRILATFTHGIHC